MLDYIFCDLDGPIFDGKWRHYHCYKDIISVFGGTAIPVDEYWDMKRNKLSRDIVLEKSAFQGSYADYFREWMDRIEQKKYLRFDKLKPQAKETLTKWSDYTENLWLVTQRHNTDNLKWQLSEFGITDCFGEVVTCPSSEKGAKYRVLKDICFNSAFFIGDTEEEMDAARLLNGKSVAITTGLRDKKFLKADFYSKEIKDIKLSCFFK